jgi:hypothetical protein
MSSPSQFNWSSIRRSLIILIVFIGGMSLYTMFLGRPGDFGGGVVGGIVGMVFGGAVGLTIGLVQVFGKWIGGRRVRSADKSSSSVE